MTPVNKEFNYLHFFISPQKKIFCSEQWVFTPGKILRLKVESRSLRLMLKSFPISQICDGDSPSCCTFLVLRRFWQFLVYIFILAQTFCKGRIFLALVVNPVIFLFANIEVRSRIWRKTLNVMDGFTLMFQTSKGIPQLSVLIFPFVCCFQFQMKQARREELTVMIMFLYLAINFTATFIRCLTYFQDRVLTKWDFLHTCNGLKCYF